MQRVKKNVICSLLLQIVTIINGLIVPRVLILYFGSEVNGLVVSITQFLNYITLLEGGLSGVVMAALYKPLREGDDIAISSIVKASEHFFRQIAMIYAGYVCVVAIIYPIIIKTPFTYPYVVCLTFALAMSLFVQYFFSLSYRLLLTANQEGYFVSIVQIVSVIFNILIVIVLPEFYCDILVIKIACASAFFLQPILFSLYVKKHFIIDKKVLLNNQALSKRWDGFSQNLAFFIHTNTDVVLLTLFSSLESVSVYSVYLLITNGLKTLLISISAAIAPTIGHVYADGNIGQVNAVFKKYEMLITTLTVSAFTCGCMLLIPFVHIYTNGIDDAPYIQPLFGWILMLAEMFYCYRDPYVQLTYVAGKFRETAWMAYLEAGTNIVVSIVLIQKFDLLGVAIGTLLSMVIRMIFTIFYLKREILHRSLFVFVKKICTQAGAAVVAVCLCEYLFNFNMASYVEWIIKAIGVGAITFSLVLTATCICNHVNPVIFIRKEIGKEKTND